MERVSTEASTRCRPPRTFVPESVSREPPVTTDSCVYQFKRVLAFKLARDRGQLREDFFRCNH